MSDLSISEIQEKIKKVKQDLETLRATGESGRKVEILTEYLDYLQDEVNFLKNEQRNKN